MANPVPVTYSSPVPKVGGGREIFPNASLDLIAAAGEGSWIKLNANNYNAAWAPEGLRPAFSNGTADPEKIIKAWSSFGWDHKRSRLVLFGGGHANSSESTVYMWDAYTRLWEIAYYSQDVRPTSNYPEYENVGGARYSPMSAHTYSNNNYLPVLDCFYTPGGAAGGAGGPWYVFSEDATAASPAQTTRVRQMGPALLDLDLAGKGFVGGLPGTNPKRLGETRDLPGARAWQMRDWGLLGDPARIDSWGAQVDGISAVRVEGGRDVVYQMRRPLQATSKSIRRVEFVDRDPANDIVSQVGAANNVPTGRSCGALHDAANCIVIAQYSTLRPVCFWDLNFAGSTNLAQTVAPGGLTGPGAASFLTDLEGDGQSNFGMAYDPVRPRLILWEWGGRVYSITPPERVSGVMPTTGWYVEIVADVTDHEQRPLTHEEALAIGRAAGAVIGKWRYAQEMDVFIGLNHSLHGNIWAWKPNGWQDPRG